MSFTIYCDGCFNGRLGGIGVISKDGSIAIRRTANASTSNEVECLAAIEALKAVKDLGLKDVLLLSDSQLVVYWTQGSYATKSQTALTYVPQIRSLLIDVNGKIGWVRGTNNPADRLSREAIGQTSLDGDDSISIDRIAHKPMDELRFRDFARLKVPGRRDKFSSMKFPSLCEKAGPEIVEQIEVEFDEPKDQASCLRWHLRGLPIDKAIRKVLTDLEISENVRMARSEGEWEC